MATSLNGDSIITELLKSFNQDNIVLFAGQEAITNGELSKEVCNLPWSCVITTCKEDDFGVRFENASRMPREIYTFNDIPLNLFNRSELPIIYLFGKNNIFQERSEDYDDEDLSAESQKRQAEKMLNRVMSKMDIRSKMIVVGYNARVENEIPEDTFIFSWEEIQGGSINIFNSTDAPSDKFKKYAIKKNLIWYDGKLASLIQNIDEEYKYDETIFDDKTNLFYKGKQPVAIKSSILSRYQSYMQLLTEERIKRVRPLGKILQNRWFYNFLNNSSDAPQWYGFLPQSEFYLKRDYEDKFFAIVKNLLANRNLAKSSVSTPIIIEGDSGSSKSIELAALAYNIFNEKINPVIFINGNNFYFASQSNELELLDELMQEVESLGEKDTRFLIIWDNSSYKNVVYEANQLSHELENRGRRFVLVCSAYRSNLSDNELKDNYKYNKDNQKIERTNEKGDYYYYNNCYFVPVTRKLSDKELWEFKKKIQQYAVADAYQINKIWEELSQNCDSEIPNDALQYFYKLIRLIRPKLEAGLSREQRLVDRYVRKQISLFEETKDDYNPIREAFLNAGIKLNDEVFELMNEQEQEEDNNTYDLERFSACIAMFSRFKIDVSYSLALRMLCKSDNEYFGKNQRYNNYNLFKVLTSQIPYIHYIEVADGNYVFRFRSMLEAEIFLNNNQITEERQIEIILQLIDYYKESYKKSSEVDFGLKEAIQNIIKMYGPNTPYRDFWEGGRYFYQHRKILEIIDRVADKLCDVRSKWHIPDTDCGFAIIEVNLYREVYGTQWEIINHTTNSSQDKNPWEEFPEVYNRKSYEKRLKKLTIALDIAQESLDTLENQLSDGDTSKERTVQASINNMLVELVLTNGIMEKVLQEYRQYISEEGDQATRFGTTLKYSQLYPRLFQAIMKEQENGYLYNALFRMFEKEYENTTNEERKLELLSTIRMIADDASNLEIQNRGYKDDELSRHLTKIAQYSSCYKVFISNIKNNTMPEPFKNLFKTMIERNNASGICFVCQQEIDSAKLDGKSIFEYERKYGQDYVLNEKQISVCKNIVEFLRNPDYEACIEKSIQALYLLFRVEWMLFNKRPISTRREWQKTYLNASDWLKIYETCEKYKSIEENSTVRPIVTLIYALAKIHINKDYVGAAKIMSELNKSSGHRMRVPYLICFNSGIPEKYRGTVLSIDKNKRNGFIQVNNNDFPLSGINQGVKFNITNLGLRRTPQKGSVLSDFELGLMWTGQYSAHKAEDGGESREQ